MGEGLGHTLSQPEKQGPFLYGMFKIIEQIAAGGKLGERGWLVRNGTPMDAARMGNLTRLPPAFFEEALCFFSSPPMDWLEWVEFSPKKSPTGPANGADDRENDRPNAATGERTTVKNKRSEERERENSGFASKGEARKAQLQQFAAAQARKRELEEMIEELSPEQEGELKKMRGLLRVIQKKQRAGDFTPVLEVET